MDTMERKMEGFIPLLDSGSQAAFSHSLLPVVGNSPHWEQPSPVTEAVREKPLSEQGSIQPPLLVSPFQEDKKYDPTDTDIARPPFKSMQLDVPVPLALNISKPDLFSNAPIVIVQDNVKAHTDYLKVVLAHLV
eukprot:2060498-Rhodomonas_salina.1